MKEYIFQFDKALYNEETGEAVFMPKVVGELIRCKDCKSCEKHRMFELEYFQCGRSKMVIQEDSFCWLAERVEE